MDELVWQDPPPAYGGRAGKGPIFDFARALQANPGKWAMYPVPTSAAMVTRLKQKFPGMEATSRSRPDGKFDIYARWAQEQEAADG